MATNPFTSAQAGPSLIGGQTLTNPEIIALERQRKMAEMLLKRGMQGQPESEMVSGYYVAPSWAQRLSPVVDQLLGQQGLKDVDEKSARLAEMLRQKDAEDLDKFITLNQGRPAQQVEMAGPYGANMGENGQNIPMPVLDYPAMEPNRAAALQFAARATNPTLRQLGMKGLTEGPIKVGVEDTLIDPITMQPVRQGMQKSPAPIETAAIVLGLDSKPRSQWTAQDRAAIDAQIQKTAQSGAMSLGQKGFDNTLKLRGDFRSEPVYKGFQEIESAFSQINAGLNSKSPAGDLAAATKFMKLLDPTSVVRESELSMAMQATGALDRLYNYANLVATGQKLTPTQREDFRKLGNEFYTTSYNQYTNKRQEYVDIAKRNDLNVDDVVGKPPKPPTVTLPPIFAINQATGERIQSTDGGNTWKPATKVK